MKCVCVGEGEENDMHFKKELHALEGLFEKAIEEVKIENCECKVCPGP